MRYSPLNQSLFILRCLLRKHIHSLRRPRLRLRFRPTIVLYNLYLVLSALFDQITLFWRRFVQRQGNVQWTIVFHLQDAGMTLIDDPVNCFRFQWYFLVLTRAVSRPELILYGGARSLFLLGTSAPDLRLLATVLLKRSRVACSRVLAELARDIL